MLPGTLTGDLSGGLPAQFRVRPDGVVIVPPSSQPEPGTGQRGEQGFVEAFVLQAAVEALGGAVLPRLAGCDEVPLDTSLLIVVEK